jgi:hypothetical protein
MPIPPIRVLPCPNCGQATLKNGEPYWLLTAPPVSAIKSVFRYACYRCMATKDSKAQSLEITVGEFYSTVPMRIEEMEQTGILARFLRDYKMGVLTDAQARDLFEAGFYPDELPALMRPPISETESPAKRRSRGVAVLRRDPPLLGHRARGGGPSRTASHPR